MSEWIKPYQELDKAFDSFFSERKKHRYRNKGRRISNVLKFNQTFRIALWAMIFLFSNHFMRKLHRLPWGRRNSWDGSAILFVVVMGMQNCKRVKILPMSVLNLLMIWPKSSPRRIQTERAITILKLIVKASIGPVKRFIKNLMKHKISEYLKQMNRESEVVCHARFLKPYQTFWVTSGAHIIRF
jgi:hypothetical protein